MESKEDKTLQCMTLSALNKLRIRAKNDALPNQIHFFGQVSNSTKPKLVAASFWFRDFEGTEIEVYTDDGETVPETDRNIDLFARPLDGALSAHKWHYAPSDDAALEHFKLCVLRDSLLVVHQTVLERAQKNEITAKEFSKAFPIDTVHKVIKRLLLDGLIYETSDDKHFRAT